jgi:hypothetical protein
MKMKRLASLTLLGAIAFALTYGGARLVKISNVSWGQEFPVEGLVVPAQGAAAFEPVPLEDIKNLSRMGFPEALRQMQARVRHVIIYRDGHYFFTTDGRVIVMTPGSDGRTPRWVDTIRWAGQPHEFRQYHKDFLPSA